jgi:hypothetical protein
LMDEENPASVLFVIKQHVVGYSQMIITWTRVDSMPYVRMWNFRSLEIVYRLQA